MNNKIPYVEFWDEQEYERRINLVKDEMSNLNKKFEILQKQGNKIKERQNQLRSKMSKMNKYLKTIISNKNLMFKDGNK